MRKIILLIMLLFITGVNFAQVSVNLQQPPPNQLRATDIWKFILINSGRTTFINSTKKNNLYKILYSI